MNITLNGKTTEISPRATIGRLLKDMKIDSILVAVEVNGEIPDKSEYDSFTIPDGAVVEIIRFMGGG